MDPLGTTHRHGYGADSVLEYTIVLADGRVAKVDDQATTIIQRDGQRLDSLLARNILTIDIPFRYTVSTKCTHTVSIQI